MNHHPFITLVDQILAAKQKDPQADTSVLERQIDPVRCLPSNGVDQMVYNLYGLTPDDIAIAEEKG